MSRWSVRMALAVGGVVAGAGVATAQPPIPGGPAAIPPPAFSPYLNIVGGGRTPAINYYGITRPQVAGRQALLGLQAGVMQNQQAIAGLQAGGAAPGGLPGTGHGTTFLNTGGYFLSNGSAAPGAAGRMTPILGGLGAANRMGLRPTNRVNAGAGR